MRISVYLSVGHIRELSLAKTTAPINIKGRPGGRGQGTIVLDWGSRYSHDRGAISGGCPAHRKTLVVSAAVYAAEDIIQSLVAA